MELHGVDVYIWTPETPDLPKQVGPLSLLLISNRGTKVYPPPAPEMHLIDWPRCRYFSETPVSDHDVNELLDRLSADGWVWTKAQKLYRIDGVDQFSKPY